MMAIESLFVRRLAVIIWHLSDSNLKRKNRGKGKQEKGNEKD